MTSLRQARVSCSGGEAGKDVLTCRRPRVSPAPYTRATLALACGLAALSPGGAHASELSWDGPADCAASEQLSFAVERALGMPLERAGTLRFHVRVESSESIASARLRVSSESGGEVSKERLLVAADCSKLVDTLAVAITLAIGASEAQPPEPASAPAQPAPAPAPIDAGASDSSAGDVGQHGPELSALIALLEDQGSLPAPALGASFGLELAWERLALRVFGSVFFEQAVEVSPELGAELNLAYGTLQACTNVLSRASSFSVPWCVGGDLGALSGVGVGMREPQRASMLWASPRVDAGAYWAVPETRLRVGALFTLAVPLNRDEFVLEAIGRVHQPSRVVGRAALGIELEL
jgi:hypothetical protein